MIKSIHEALKGKLDVTYVSIDGSSTVSEWPEVVKKLNVPGRSLLASDSLEQVKNKYLIDLIPYSFLVHPEGKMEVIDVRTDKGKERLFALINGNNGG